MIGNVIERDSYVGNNIVLIDVMVFMLVLTMRGYKGDYCIRIIHCWEKSFYIELVRYID